MRLLGDLPVPAAQEASEELIAADAILYVTIREIGVQASRHAGDADDIDEADGDFLRSGGQDGVPRG